MEVPKADCSSIAFGGILLNPIRFGIEILYKMWNHR